ncbi:hypothetical protein ATZ33_11900 [Enterococcus silesiacus]|uniref:Uncharacterized protein n=1 Tax=Enterococcus silesiacus TaxID=332949 RepID=A0A0S3KCL7_9ENTE|nr:hypothetical protein [Enterococcus silesiacus]ALS02061.1 hypothetical protein ATZ33_11900 [Enterococcus silesiacus]OJG84342.1 hypothetical protein RV15_GL003101 [Enterococcus silesiacus]
MKKIYLIGMLLLLVVGCSKIGSSIKDTKDEVSPIVLKFQGMKLFIKNETKDIITILESETEFSIKKNNKWELIDETRGLTIITTNILSEEETELDLTNELSKLKEKELKVTIHYELNSESREESIVYVK